MKRGVLTRRELVSASFKPQIDFGFTTVLSSFPFPVYHGALDGSSSWEVWERRGLFEETGVADRSREGADEKVTDVLKVIRQLEEYRQELKRLRRLLKDADKPSTNRCTLSLNSIERNTASYIS